MSDAIAANVAHGWVEYKGMGPAHFEQLKALLDREDASYRS